MDSIRLDGHKKILGILYVVSAVLTITGMILVKAILSIVFSFVLDEANADDRRVIEMVLSLMQVLPYLIIIFFSIPTLIAGVGLLTKQRWATLFALIMGCLKLFSFPIGTAIGIYAIWIYSEDHKLNALPTQ
jgi:ABC-type tungstate transport system substrate-binding protein